MLEIRNLKRTCKKNHHVRSNVRYHHHHHYHSVFNMIFCQKHNNTSKCNKLSMAKDKLQMHAIGNVKRNQARFQAVTKEYLAFKTS